MLRNVVLRELKGRYKGSFIGFLWTFCNPILMIIVFSVVFTHILRTEIQNYPLFIFVALLPWNFFVNAVLQGSTSLIQNAALVKKIFFPREVLPIATVLSHAVNYVLSLVIMLPALWIAGVSIEWTYAAFPVVLLLQILFVLMIVMVVSVVTVFIRDLEHFLGIFLFAMFYLTPVLFPISLIPDEARWIFDLNPVTPMIEAYRDIFFYGEWPDWIKLAKLAVAVLLLNVAAFRIFDVLQKRVAEEL
jgi:ABC-2 type transport system permease protein